jgi:hypothetical protein
MEVEMVMDVPRVLLAVVQEGLHLHMVLEAQEVGCLVEEELPVQVVVFLVKQVLWVKVETEEPRHMVLAAVAVDTMAVARECRVVVVVMAAGVADPPTRIRVWQHH